MTAVMDYVASPAKRARATKAEMEQRAEFLIAYAEAHGPVTVRGLYYQAEVSGLPGIDKEESSYNKIQRQVLSLRRSGRLDYEHIADATRWMRKPRSFDSVEDALADTARLYRKNLWRNAKTCVEIWLEKDALAGVILPVTAKYDVPLMVSRGFTSETFAYETIAQRAGDYRPLRVYALYDFDRSGQDAANSLKEKLTRFAGDAGMEVKFELIGVTVEQIVKWGLPTREPKRLTVVDKNWQWDFACELDAIPPDTLRELVELTIDEHLNQEQLHVLRVAEASERELLRAFIKRVA